MSTGKQSISLHVDHASRAHHATNLPETFASCEEIIGSVPKGMKLKMLNTSHVETLVEYEHHGTLYCVHRQRPLAEILVALGNIIARKKH